MDIDTLLSYEWKMMTPEFIVLGTATLLSLLDLFVGKRIQHKVLGYMGIVGILAAALALVSLLDAPSAQILDDIFRLDAFAKMFKLLLLAGAALVMFLAIEYRPKKEFSYRGEFYYLFLTALLGAMMMTSSGDLITLFIGLELLSLSSYILAGIQKDNKKSNESAMKYVINGGISTAFILFGMSYVYGLTGSTRLLEIAVRLSQMANIQYEFLLAVAFLMIFVGLSFKLASAPFHMWAPDVYEGAPVPVTAFLSVVSKTAGFVILFRIFITVFANAPARGGETSLLVSMQDYIALLAAATMIIGNTVALKQQNVKRLFAYSSIAHAGYILVAFTALSPFVLDAMWFYLMAYLLMNIGAFIVIQLVTSHNQSEEISSFTGLYRRSPALAILMGIFLLSLAGIPGTAGFIGKVNIFMGALVTEPAHYVLAGIMIATTIVSYYYYFGLFVQIFFRPAGEMSGIRLSRVLLIPLAICAAGTILMGVFPNIAYEFFFEHLGTLEDFFS
ncbi:MAG TPA: NADH-quinone oxidoreductase subunit NuoN [Bacillus sp. (in: firmicutes)]|nr:NADH-quinone oxidoreductase subunit NuoN [Bacillus sp. (in: firmicutes)]